MRNLILLLFSTLFTINTYSQKELLPEYPGGKKAFEEYLTKGMSLSDTIDTEIYTFQLNVYVTDAKVQLEKSHTWFYDSNSATLDTQLLELIKKMPKWEIKDSSIDFLQLDGYLAFSSEGVRLELRRTDISNLTSIDEILAHQALSRDESDTNTIADSQELKEEKRVIDIKTLEVLEDKALENEDRPFVTVEQMPHFPGGEAEMMKFIHKNLRIEAVPQEEGLCTRLTARFVLEADGSISGIETIRGCSEAADKAFREVLGKMPAWIPGKQNGKNVAVYYTLSMNIHLKQ